MFAGVAVAACSLWQRLLIVLFELMHGSVLLAALQPLFACGSTPTSLGEREKGFPLRQQWCIWPMIVQALVVLLTAVVWLPSLAVSSSVRLRPAASFQYCGLPVAAVAGASLLLYGNLAPLVPGVLG